MIEGNPEDDEPAHDPQARTQRAKDREFLAALAVAEIIGEYRQLAIRYPRS